MADLPALSLTVILDADAEVYRMGYGDPEALEIIRKASKEAMFDLREQPGVRIGVVISDDRTMVYAPVSRNVEAGSTTDEKPNAIMLDGAATENLAVAAGASDGETEIGVTGMEPERVAQMQADLTANPPKPFDLTRRLTVFTSAVEFVDLKVSNYKLSKRRVSLPQEFVGVGDEALKQRISSQIRAPFDGIGAQKMKLEGEDAELLVDEAFIEKERKDIEDASLTTSIGRKTRKPVAAASAMPRTIDSAPRAPIIIGSQRNTPIARHGHSGQAHRTGLTWQNGFAERLIGSIRRECLDHAIICGEAHLRRVLKSYADYYNRFRTHRSLNKDAPVSRSVQRTGVICSRAILGGLHHHYGRI
jgi:hypothetical protein